jgi:hypothetical protein
MAAKKSTPTPKPTPPPVKGFEGLKGAGQGVNDFLNTVGKGVGAFGAILGTTFGQSANPYASRTPAKITTNKTTGSANGGSLAGGIFPSSSANTDVPFYLRPPVKIQQQKGSNVSGSGGGKKYMTPDQLFVDPTPAYQPVLDYLNQQGTAAKDRYAVNAANIKNIFSSLTGLTAQDSARITKQFKDSLAASKADLAARTAEARAGAAAGAAQATVTGAERGGGPEMVASPVQQAVDESIGRSNEYATTWQALQAANEQQAQADISARGAGYGQQEVGAIQQLAQNLEDRLLAIGGNTAQVQSDIAQAKFSQQREIQGVKFQISEQARAAAEAARAAAAAKPSYGKDLFGLQKQMNDNGQDFNKMMASVDAAYTSAWDLKNPRVGDIPVSKTVNPPKAADVKASWIANGGDPALLPYVDRYVSTVYR